MSGWATLLVITLGTPPSYPPTYPPSPREGPQGHKGGLGSVFRSGTCHKIFRVRNSREKVSLKNERTPLSNPETQKKISGKIKPPQVVSI